MNYEASVVESVRKPAVPRHIAIVRITHWIVVLSVIGLLVSGTGILVSHPRLYWGETGSLGTESLIFRFRLSSAPRFGTGLSISSLRAFSS